MPFEKSAAFYDAIYSFRDYAKDARAIHRLIAREKGSKGRDLLDVACGTGLHMAHLRRWYRVEGIDLDPNMLRVARKRLPGAAVHRADMRNFELGRQFDVVLNMFGSIGYVRTLSGLRRAAGAMSAHLEPGGVMLVEPWVLREKWERGNVGSLLAEADGVKVARVSRSLRRGKLSIVEFAYLISSSNGIRTIRESHTLGLFSRAEYAEAFRRAGLGVRWDAGGLFGSRGLFVCRKP